MSLADLLGSKPLADDDSGDEDAQMGSVSGGSGGSGASGDEGEGVNLMGENTGDEDSSEEGEDDSEEEREVRKGFIVDEDDSSRKRKDKKKKKRSKSGGEGSSKKRRKDSDDDAGDLDEDDLALLEENTGVKITGRSKGHKLKRLRRRRSASEDSGASDRPGDLTNIFDEEEEDDEGESTGPRGGRGDYEGPELFDADEMAGFIEDDTQSESSGRRSDEDSGDDDGDRAARRAMKKKQRQKEKSQQRKKGRRAGFGAGFVEGITAEAWQEVTDVFGNGQDYAYALEDDADAMQGDRELKDIFEPSEIASRMLTESDDLIRSLDIPERMQLSSVGLVAPSTILPPPPHVPKPKPAPTFDENGEEIPAPPAEDDEEEPAPEIGAVPPFIAPADLPAAAAWMSQRISPRATQEFVLRSANGQLPALHDEFVTAVKDVVRFINVDFFEVPFIWAHRGDYLVAQGGGDDGEDKAFLDLEECWNIAALSIKWRALAMRKAELRKTFNALDTKDEYFEELFEAASDVTEVADLSDWLSMKYSRKLAEIKEEKLREEEAAAVEAGEGEIRRRQKRATRESAYEVAKRNFVSKLAESIGLSATELAKAYNKQIKIETVEDPQSEPLTLAEGYSGDGSEYATPEAALAAAKMIAVHEIARDPQLRKKARSYIIEYGVVTVVPTEKGQQKIDEMHPFYAFKYLKNKPLALFSRSAQFLQILTGEKEGLVQVRLELPETAADMFINDLTQVYCSESVSSVAEAWNEVRSEIVHQAVHSHLVPAAQVWKRNTLQEEEEEFIGGVCRERLYRRINVAPFRRADGTMEKGDTPTVFAISHGNGDPKRDDIVGVFIDAEGHFREHVKISNLFSPSEQERADLVELLRRRRPQVVVVGGWSPSTKRLMADFRSFAQGVTDLIVAEGEDQPGEGSDEPRLSVEELTSRATFESIYVYDDVAKIYSNSQRAALEFPDLNKLGKYCVGLARYAQSPLNEYAALGPDLTALSYDDTNQKFLTPQKLLPHLERALIEVVNRLGVDINKATRNSYYYHLLPYVAGLGPRKADGLVKKMNATVGGTLANRDGLITHKLFTKNIFFNAAGFLRIPQDDLNADLRRSNEETEQPEILDDTRIHPEDYEIARKMAADAMEVDEEETAQYTVKSQAVIDLIDEDTGKLDDLSLSEFAAELKKLHLIKRLTLYAIRDELQHPYAEPRPDFLIPSPADVFSMLSGETNKTLDRGLIIPVRVIRMRTDGVVLVRLDSGLEGTVQVGYRRDGDDPDSYRAPPQGTTLQAQVIELRPDTFEVELNAQESVLAAGDREHRKVLRDSYWDTAQADAEREAQAAVEQKATGRQKRIIKHPNFQNIDSGKAEEYLSHMQRGDCVIRPSSKEDHLAVTWKVADGIYQHIAVHELNKVNEFSLGSTLRVAGVKTTYNYSDLDELIVSHVKQMALKVNEMTSHEKFKGKAEELDKWIGNAVMANPDRSFYGFGYDPDRRKAGQFVLGFKANLKAETKYWNIGIVPGAFVLLHEEHGSVLELCNAFKTAYNARTDANPALLPHNAGGRTGPYQGGRTPAPRGNMTPMQVGRTPMGQAARTPNPYMQNRTPLAPSGGATPGYRGADPRGGPPISSYNAGYGQQPPQAGGWQQQAPWQQQQGYGGGPPNGQGYGGQR